MLCPTTAGRTGADTMLYRAIVSLPPALRQREYSFQERIVFFEASLGDHAGHLERLLALVWCVDTTGWVEQGQIYNIDHEPELVLNHAIGGPDTGDLRLFEIGCGGENGIGPHRVLYAKAADVDLFVSPRERAQLATALERIEELRPR